MLSDRVLVMSRRPGRIIDEITIDIPGRDDRSSAAPIRRSQTRGRLMDRLHIGQPEAVPA